MGTSLPPTSFNVEDEAVYRLRLEMEWKEFDPTNGKLRAEGTGHLFASRIIRSVSLCLEYTHTHTDRVVRSTPTHVPLAVKVTF